MTRKKTAPRTIAAPPAQPRTRPPSSSSTSSERRGGDGALGGDDARRRDGPSRRGGQAGRRGLEALLELLDAIEEPVELLVRVRPAVALRRPASRRPRPQIVVWTDTDAIRGGRGARRAPTSAGSPCSSSCSCGSRFRSFPHIGHSPAQSSRHRICSGTASAIASRAHPCTSSRSLGQVRRAQLVAFAGVRRLVLARVHSRRRARRRPGTGSTDRAAGRRTAARRPFRSMRAR